jgi:hypothetical protein
VPLLAHHVDRAAALLSVFPGVDSLLNRVGRRSLPSSLVAGMQRVGLLAPLWRVRVVNEM